MLKALRSQGVSVTATSPQSAVPAPSDITPVPVGHGPFQRLFHSAIHYRDFRILWFGLLASFTAFQMQLVGYGYVGYALTESPLALGLLFMTWGGSQFGFALVGGAMADRLPKREVLRITQGIMAASSLVVAVLISLDLIAVWHLAVVGLIQGTAFAFNGPARSSFLPAVVPRADVANAIALNNGGMNVARAVAPAIAGVLISVHWLGPAAVFYVMTFFYLMVQVSLMAVRNRGVTEFQGTRRSVLADVRAGLGFAFRSPVVRLLLLLGMLPLVLGSSTHVLLPAYAAAHLETDAAGLGLLYTAGGVGAILGSLAVAYFSTIRHRGLVQLGVGAGIGAGLLVAGTTTSFPLAFLGLFITGICLDAYLAMNNALLMLSAPREMYGRVMSLMMLSFSLSGFTAGPLGAVAGSIGTGNTFALAGIVLAAVMLGALVVSRRLRELSTPAPAAS